MMQESWLRPLAKAGYKQKHKSDLDSDQISAYQTRQSEHVHYQPISVRARTRQKAAARMHRNLKPMRFVSLHHHSTYSFLDGFQLPEAHVRRAAEIKMGAIAWTEHGNIFSHVKGEKACEDSGVKSIFGCEFYVGWTDEKRRSQRKNHLTVIAKNDEGYRNLLQLVTLSWRKGFYHEPTVDPRWLVKHRKGLIILSGCQGSQLFTSLMGGKLVKPEDASFEKALSVAQWFAKRFEDYYIEVQAFPELEKTVEANPMLARIAYLIKRPLVATMDVHYTAPEEAEVQQVLHNTRPGQKKTLEQMVQDWGYNVPLCPPATDKAIFKRLLATGLTKDQALEAIVSTEEIAQECNVVLPKQPKVEFPLPPEFKTAKSLWRAKIEEGWKYRGFDKLPVKERNRYRKQLRKEVEIMEAKNYIGYFLIVADFVVYAKDLQIPVGPARGSAAASLVCFLLRITEIDPMLYPNLIFERFIDWSREDMPDVDLDFATYGLPIIRRYAEEKYGKDCANYVGTFTMYKSKNSLDDAARVHKVPEYRVKEVKELLLERSSGDLRASATIEDTIDQFDEARAVIEDHPGLVHAMDLEGNAKAFGVHAAGLVISNEPITNVTPIIEREVNGEKRYVVGMDKWDAERQGLEKLDFLSLKTMDMIADIIKHLGKNVEDLYAIPLDDPSTIKGFQENDVVGVFQFDGRATRIVNGSLKPDNFDEIAFANALSRPGPLHNGAAAAYIAVKHGGAEPEHIHPALDAITDHTKGQIIFQEQILRIVVEIGGFNWTGASYIRRIISKKLGDAEFNRQWAKFWEGARTVHERFDVPRMDEATARAIWGLCITAGSYAFNAAHSYSYGMLAVWCMFLKRNAWGHGPAQFYASALSKLPDTDGKKGQTPRHESLRRDAMKHNVAVMPPDAKARASWRAVGDQTIVAGWEQIPGIGPKVAAKIADHISEATSSVDFGDGLKGLVIAGTPKGQKALESRIDLTEIPGVGPKTVEKINEFQQAEDPFDLQRVDRILSTTREHIAAGEKGPLGAELPNPTHTANQALEALGGRITFLGIPFHRNLRDLFESNRARTGEALDPKKVSRPDLSEWLMMLCRDEEEIISVCFPRKKYPRFKEAVWKLKLNEDAILIQGKKASSHMKGSLTAGQNRTGLIYVDKLWVIEP